MENWASEPMMSMLLCQQCLAQIDIEHQIMRRPRVAERVRLFCDSMLSCYGHS